MPGFDTFLQEHRQRHTVTRETVSVDSYVVINSILQSKGRGIAYRRSTNIDDKSDKMATWGSVVRGSLVEEDWLKAGPNSYLPVKINGYFVLLQQSSKGDHQDIARDESRSATVHWRLKVSGCRDQELGSIFRGTYTQVGDHHDRPAFKKIAGDSAIYFCDKHDGGQFAGWWFGNSVGSARGLALNPSTANAPPGKGWQVPWGEGVDNSMTIKGVETKSITVQGHKDSSYNGKYKLQERALNKHPWFKKAAPFRILYCFTKGDSGEISWNLDWREQKETRGIRDWSAGGYYAGGFIPFGTACWQHPNMELTLLCDDADEDEAYTEERTTQPHDHWGLPSPWELMFSKKRKGPVYFNTATGEVAHELADTGIEPEIMRRLTRLNPTYEGLVNIDDLDLENMNQAAVPKRDLMAAPPAKRAAPKKSIPVEVEPPSKPGAFYLVGSGVVDKTYVAKVHAAPREDSGVITALAAGSLVELHEWDASHKWRMFWYIPGRTTTIGVWGFVKFFNSEGEASFKPKDWRYSSPVPLGLLGTAVWENDRLQVHHLIKEHADINAAAKVIQHDGRIRLRGLKTLSKMPLNNRGPAIIGEEVESMVTPLLLAGWAGHGDLAIQLLMARADPLTQEVGLQSSWLKRPVDKLLRALSGEEDVPDIDEALNALRSDTRENAENLLEKMAEEKLREKMEQEDREEQEEAQRREEGEQETAQLLEQRLSRAGAAKQRQKEKREMEEREKEQKEKEQREKEERERRLEQEERERKEKEIEARRKPAKIQKPPSAEAEADRESAIKAARDKMQEKRKKKHMEAAAEAEWAVNTAPILAASLQDSAKEKKDHKRIPQEEPERHKAPPAQAVAAPAAATSAPTPARARDAEADHQAQQERQRREWDAEMARSKEKWSCGECGDDNEGTHNTCYWCGSSRS